MRRAHSCRSWVRLARRWATSSRSRSALASWWPFVAVSAASEGSAISLLRLGCGAEGQDRDVVAQPAFRSVDHRGLDAVGDGVRRQPAAALQQVHELAVAEHLAPAPADLGDAV